MKALQIIQYGAISESLAINEVEKPTLKPNDVLVAVKAAGLNPIDYKMVEGKLKEMFVLKLPIAIGFDLSGVVVATCAAVSDFKTGDEVYARVPQEQMGTVAEFVSINSNLVARKPTNSSFEEAAGLPLAGLTAMQALDGVGIKENDRILIHAGSGGVGSFAIQYAKAKGAIVYTTTSSKNVDWVKALGADRVIDYKTEDYKEIANNLDLVFDTLGDEYTTDAFEIIKQGGKIATIAGPLDAEIAKHMGIKDYKVPENLAQLIEKKEAVYKFTWIQPDAQQLNSISKMVEEGTIKPIIDLIYPLEDAIDAYLYVATGRAKGKVIVRMP